jgi:hypothetical protein
LAAKPSVIAAESARNGNSRIVMIVDESG